MEEKPSRREFFLRTMESIRRPISWCLVTPLTRPFSNYLCFSSVSSSSLLERSRIAESSLDLEKPWGKCLCSLCLVSVPRLAGTSSVSSPLNSPLTYAPSFCISCVLVSLIKVSCRSKLMLPFPKSANSSYFHWKSALSNSITNWPSFALSTGLI